MKIFLLLVSLTNLAYAQPTHLILISIDGLKPEYLTQREKLNLKIPNLARLMEMGSYTEGAEGVFPTVTYPSHSSIVTGVRPAKHGITHNTVFDPLGTNQSGWFWYAEAIKAKTLWQAAKERGAITASVFWPVTVGADMDYNIPEHWRAKTPEDIHLLRALCFPPGILQDIEREYGELSPKFYEQNQVEGLTDQMRANALKYLIIHKKPNLLLGHLTNLDDAQHESGPFSEESLQTLERIDGLIGQIIEAVRTAGIYDETAFAIVSDHGFLKIDKMVRLGLLLKNNDLLTTNDKGDVTGWKVAMHGNGPMVGIMLKDSSDLESLKKVTALLRKTAKDPANGIARIYDKKEMAKYGGFPEAAFVVEAKPGYIFSSTIREPLVVPSTAKGYHGYSPFMPEMRASFVVAGNGIQKGVVVKKIRLIDVAPTLARLMGWQMSRVEGKVINAFLKKPTHKPN